MILLYRLKRSTVKIATVLIIIIIAIESFYNQFKSAIKRATQKCIPPTKSFDKFDAVPGWNEYVKEHHDITIDAFHWWTFNNRPRHGPIYYSMTTSTAQFKYVSRRNKRDLP